MHLPCSLGTKVGHIARFWSHITHVIWDLAHFQNAIWDQGELSDLRSHIAHALVQYRTCSNTSPRFARYGTILRVPTTKCPIFLSLLMGISPSLSSQFPSSYTVHHFQYLHLFFRSSPFFSEVSSLLINPRIVQASDNLPQNFCRQMSCCIAESQRHCPIGIMWESPSLNM